MQPFFLPVLPGSVNDARFALLYRPNGPVKSLVVFAHPFAEEMNKSRRMASTQARALASQGTAVLLPDLLGCGDSGGEFGDANWATWVDDIVCASTWLREQSRGWATLTSSPAPPLTLWGLRGGALLAAEAAARLGDVHRLLLWQPILTGKTMLHQFLRLQLAGELVGGETRGNSETLRARLAAGDSVDLAGYRLAPALAQGLERARLELSPGVRQVLWLEVSQRDDATLTPASATVVAAWREAGCDVQAEVSSDPSFWQTTEIEDAPRLVKATLFAMAQAMPESQPLALPA